jgi:hypothetical protein
MTEEVHSSGNTFSTVQATHSFWQRWVGLQFGRFFSQTHLVTLPGANKRF